MAQTSKNIETPHFSCKVDTLNEKVARALKIISYAYRKYGDITIANSFGKDSMVTMHLVLRVVDRPDVFSVLSDTEFQETLDLRDKVVNSFDIDYREFSFNQPDRAFDDVSVCCGKVKVEATEKALEGYDAWVTGLRVTESETRRDAGYIEEDKKTVKINPIRDFTELDVWRYTAINEIPVNDAYRKGYRSLGCTNCTTLPESRDESERAGRWREADKTECGIHTTSI
ncbi:3'-phosphoadenosine 5'-phosphosulfate sulfotransferase, PAPS reductase [Methanonatronarchaeum thermophilum]|uniref:3'-phosphoadenosine 5'-phosphosulfate sulfotransferase, PAPS reductase n=1 Tax=Methanonatronarchaeum thermophilum TaxID=1927129 RepID=A0A1Y3GAY7_9EURY|nr:phosphoadenylyl-sulfate reductase [Methanonatronarchaeum thermophilum]OUJ18410.1 3'-phosphoadenosine 5'-phosphosulfate sulfotransferase, PAPS reductase [Methanonatronarchaeum thermophilum]